MFGPAMNEDETPDQPSTKKVSSHGAKKHKKGKHKKGHGKKRVAK